jgi:hypothetical protein
MGRGSCPLFSRAAIALLFLPLRPAGLGAQEAEARPVFVEQGFLLEADIAEARLRVLGRFHPAAPTAARAPDGLIWGRSGERELAALDPATGRIVATVLLPMRPYDHLVAPNGKAYVTHHTLTSEGFWLSVVDTRERRLCATIRNIGGLKTGLESGGGRVFLSTVDPGSDGSLRVYALDAERESAREILREPKTGPRLILCCRGDRLYLLRSGGLGTRPEIQVLAAGSGETLRRIAGEALAGVQRFTGRMLVRGDRGYVPCAGEGGQGFAEFDFAAERVLRVRSLPSPVWRLLGADGDLLAFLLAEAEGSPGTTLVFYDLGTGKEVKRVSLPDFLKSR